VGETEGNEIIVLLEFKVILLMLLTLWVEASFPLTPELLVDKARRTLPLANYFSQ
jgi:hypothetical protein